MSKMGQMVMEIQELFEGGCTVEEIMKMTKTPREFVQDVIKDYSNDWPEPEPDF